MRGSLERRAEDVDMAAPVARQAIAAVRRRHRGWLAAGFAAASVAAIVVVVGGRQHAAPTDGSRRSAGDRTSTLASEWRTEYWRDIQVEVPADWAWGVSTAHQR